MTSLSDALEFKDISTEQYRTYVFPGGEEYTIANPLQLSIKAPLFNRVGGGSHRVIDAQGISHYISYGWLAIHWKVKDGEMPISF